MVESLLQYMLRDGASEACGDVFVCVCVYTVADPAMGPRGPGPPLFSYQNINIHYCVHAFFREYH